MTLSHEVRRDLLWITVVAIAVFIIHAIAWPLAAGRDGASYLYYLLDYGSPKPEEPFTMMLRAPLAPLFSYFVAGVLGPVAGELLMGLIFVGVNLVLYACGLLWRRTAGLALVGIFLLHSGWGSFFHVVSNDPYMVILFPVLMLLAFLAATRGSPWLFAATGIAAALFLFGRPGVFGLLGLTPLFFPRESWKRKLLFAASFYAAFAPLPMLWCLHNQQVYGEFTFSPGATAVLPLGRVMGSDYILHEANGPNSRLLAEAVREKFLAKDPALANVTPDQYFVRHPLYLDYVPLAQEKWGSLNVLRGAGWEAVRAYPIRFFVGVAKTFVLTMAGNLRFPVPQPGGLRFYTHKRHVTFVRNGHDTWIPMSEFDPSKYVDDGSSQREADKIGPNMAKATRIMNSYPARRGSVLVGSILNWASYLYPPILLWFVLSVWAFLWGSWDPRRVMLAALFALAFLNCILPCMAMWTQVYEYRMPFDPVFVLPGLLYLLGKAEPTLRGRGLI